VTDVATPPLDEATRREIAGTCTYFHARRATRILAEVFDDALRPHGLKGTQFTLLAAVGLQGEATVGGLAEALDADRTTLTRTLAPLERDGLLESRPGADRRERRMALTDAGERTLAEAYPAWHRAQASIVEGLGTADWERLMAGLAAVRDLGRP
jgi:DNA-binding MarR family transcriptional regulator